MGRRTIVPTSTQQALQSAPEEQRLDMEMQVREPAQGPLARLANAFARTMSAAGEAMYDYSGGQYGLHPLDAKELRHEWKRERNKEREHGRTVAAITVRERRSGPRRRTWLPVVGGLVGAVVGAIVVVVWQRRRLRAAADRAVALGRRAAQQIQQQMASRTSPQQPPPHERPVEDHAITPTSERVAR
jgi:hypothetical protein